MTITAVGQDIHFSQITRTPFLINPAFTGTFAGNFQGTINWKDQWQSVQNTYRTYATSAEFSFGKGRALKPTFYGVGMHASRDVAGDIEVGNTNFGLSFSSLFKISRNQRLTFGLQSSIGSLGFNQSKMQWGSQYNGLNFDPTLLNGEGLEYASFQYLDISAGVGYWYHKSDKNVAGAAPQDAKVGFAVYHINKPYYSFSSADINRLPMRFIGHASALFSTKYEAMYWYPNVTAIFQGSQNELLIGSLWKFILNTGSKNTGYGADVAVSAGASMRTSNVVDAIIPQVYFDVQYFTFGLSYDINISALSVASRYRGGFELSVRFTNPDGYTHRNPFRRAVAI
jgi:type IX secretion system PorP/SprF family membrane protein